MGEGGAIYYYDGSQWTDQSLSGRDDELFGVFGISAEEVFAVGEDATIYYYDGTSWTHEHAPRRVTEDLHDIWGSELPGGHGSFFAVGAAGRVIRYYR